MIGKLRGVVEHLRHDGIILNVGNVGYLVFVSTATLEKLRYTSDEVSLFIETHVREDHIHLYGFLSEAEQEMFLTLITVQGVGAKMGLAILSVFSATDIGNIILAQDKNSLTRVSGVGKRIAERIVTELKNKLPALEAALPAPAKGEAPTHASSDMQDALSALEHLGYARIDAMKALQVASADNPQTLDDWIKLGLAQLGT